MLLASGRYQTLAPQAFAETTPQFYASQFLPDVGIQLAREVVTYGVMYKVQSNVFSCVDKIATLIARLDSAVFDESDASKVQQDDDSDFAALMRNPCLTVDPYHFYHWLSTTYETYGEAYLLKNRNETGAGRDRTRVVSLIPMHPAMTAIRRAEDGTQMYQFMAHPNQLIPETEVIPFRRYNPFNTMRGMSRLEPLRLTLLNDEGARRAQNSMWDKMCRPSMVLSTPKRLGPQGRQRLQAAVRAANGSADNAGGTMVLEDEVTATRMQLGPEEMQYLESRQFNRDEVCSVYDISAIAIQFLSMNDSGIAGYDDVMKNVYKFSIDHRLKAFQSTINHHLATEPAFGGNKRFQFNVARQLRGDVTTLAPAAVQLLQSGIGMPNEMREWFDLPHAGPVGDKLYANQALRELGAEPEPPASSNPGDWGNPNATNNQHNAVGGDQPKKVPAIDEKAMMYRRWIASHIGRGEPLVGPIQKWLDSNPADYQAIRQACESFGNSGYRAKTAKTDAIAWTEPLEVNK